MKNKKIITMTAYKRYDYTKQVLDHLKNCTGFDGYKLLANVEPGHPEVINLFKQMPNCDLVVNAEKLGCSTNTFNALERGFELSDFVIHMEDDTLPGVDCLKYFEWINKTYKNDDTILTATAYNRVFGKDITTENCLTVQKCHWFTGWIWATWNDRFKEMSNNWDYVDKYGWDVNINKNIRGDRYEIQPMLPRSRNIGQYEGTYSSPELWESQQYSPFWINDFPEVLKLMSEYDVSHIDPYYETMSINCPVFDTDNSNTSLLPLLIVGVGLTYLMIKGKT